MFSVIKASACMHGQTAATMSRWQLVQCRRGAAVHLCALRPHAADAAAEAGEDAPHRAGQRRGAAADGVDVHVALAPGARAEQDAAPAAPGPAQAAPVARRDDDGGLEVGGRGVLEQLVADGDVGGVEVMDVGGAAAAAVAQLREHVPEARVLEAPAAAAAAPARRPPPGGPGRRRRRRRCLRRLGVSVHRRHQDPCDSLAFRALVFDSGRATAIVNFGISIPAIVSEPQALIIRRC